MKPYSFRNILEKFFRSQKHWHQRCKQKKTEVTNIMHTQKFLQFWDTTKWILCFSEHFWVMIHTEKPTERKKNEKNKVQKLIFFVLLKKNEVGMSLSIWNATRRHSVLGFGEVDLSNLWKMNILKLVCHWKKSCSD